MSIVGRSRNNEETRQYYSCVRKVNHPTEMHATEKNFLPLS